MSSAIQRFPQTVYIQTHCHFYQVTVQQPIPSWFLLAGTSLVQDIRPQRVKVWRQDSAVLQGGMAAFRAKFPTAILPAQLFPGMLWAGMP